MSNPCTLSDLKPFDSITHNLIIIGGFMSRKLILVSLFFITFFSSSFSKVAANTNNDLMTVNYVDVGRYLGAWYRIASYPLAFEGVCTCARQVLSAGTDGKIDVYNSCNRGGVNGPLAEIRGFAISDDPVSNARLTVDFNLPKKGQYWIIGLDSDYRYAVVSDPSRSSLYILSKTPALSDELYQAALSEASKQMDISKLEIAQQAGCTYPN